MGHNGSYLGFAELDDNIDIVTQQVAEEVARARRMIVILFHGQEIAMRLG